MNRLWNGLKAFWHDDKGATATEYAVMIALIIGVAFVAVVILGEVIEQAFNDFASEMASAVESSG